MRVATRWQGWQRWQRPSLQTRRRAGRVNVVRATATLATPPPQSHPKETTNTKPTTPWCRPLNPTPAPAVSVQPHRVRAREAEA